MARFRNVVFTVNNWTEEDKAYLVSNDEIKYIVYGEEVAPTTGTKHLQCYAEFYSQYGLKAAKKILGPRAAEIQSRKASQQIAIAYCKKGEQSHEEWKLSNIKGPNYGLNAIVFEDGEPNQSGKRNDLDVIKSMVNDGTSQIEVISQCSNFQQIRYTEKLFEYKPLSPEYKKREVYWFWGPTGLGKTRAAYDIVKEKKLDFWVSTLNGSQWFNGYWGQPIAILDEVRAKDYPYVSMLRLLDGYEVRMPYKGGFTIWNPDIVIITSPVKPEDCYAGQMEFNDGGIDQLMRRITQVREFKAEPAIVVPTMFLKRTHEESFYAEMDEALEDYCERNHHGKRGDQ